MQERRPVMLAVLDGWGWREETADNAVRQARTPAFDRLWAAGPHALLRTSGADVGLPPGQMGNSEVGHLNIGAGRIVKQTLQRITDAIADGEIARSPALRGLIERLRQSGGVCHLMGLASPGGVHSHQDHAAALAGMLAQAGVPALVHAFTDGRDTPPRSAEEDIRRLAAALPPSVSIATVCGRYYAMDRDKRWERVAKAYAAIVEADGPRFPDAGAVIADAYAHDLSDEFVLPAVVGGYRGMRDGDAVLCFNFRADRVREILSALLDPGFSGFARPRVVLFAAADAMGPFGADYPYAFLHERVKAICAEKQVPYLDLLPAFAKIRDPHSTWVSPFDAHPNAQQQHLREIPGEPASRSHHAPNRETYSDDSAAAPRIGESAKWDAEEGVEKREAESHQQAHLKVGYAKVAPNGPDKQTKNLPVDE